jgi:cell division protein ZapA (FtsZ GTPase activity inhibitor)
MKPVEINVIGTKVRVQGENAQKIQEYAEFLDNFLREINTTHGTLDQKTLFILAGLNLTEQIFELKEKNDQLSQELNKVNSLLQNL